MMISLLHVTLHFLCYNVVLLLDLTLDCCVGLVGALRVLTTVLCLVYRVY